MEAELTADLVRVANESAGQSGIVKEQKELFPIKYMHIYNR